MAFTYIRVTRTYELATDVPATGSVQFRPIDRMLNGLTVVSAPVLATLDGSGTIDVRLAATTDPATRPVGVTYEVREQITGQAAVTYYVSVPHTAPGAAVDLSTLSVISPVETGAFNLVDAADYDDTTPPSSGDAMVWNGASAKWRPSAAAAAGVVTVNGEFPDGAGNLVLSPSDVGAQPADADLTGLGGLGDGYPKRAGGTWAAQTAAQTATDLGVQNTTPVTLTASGGVITPTAGSGWYFQHTAAANVTLANPTGGTSGQLIVVDVFASGADRVVTLPAGTTPATVTVTSGTWHPFEMRNHSGTWQTIDYLAVSSGGTVPDGSITNVKVAAGAAISADKLVDGTANKILTSAERATIATAAAIQSRVDALEASATVIAANTQTASYTLALADAGKVVEINSAGATTVTVPANSTVGYPIGTVAEVLRYGAGAVTLAGAAGTVFAADTFDRADSTTTLGTSSGGQVWTAGVGTWGISGNQAYLVTGTGQCVATVNAGQSDCTVTATMPVNSNYSLVFRYSDANNYFIVDISNGVIWRNQAASFTSLTGIASTAGPGTWAVTLSGSAITVFKDGVQVNSTTDTFNQTATRHGMNSFQNAAARWDDFSVTTSASTVSLVRPAGSPLTLRAQGSTASLRKRATNEWVVSGDLG